MCYVLLTRPHSYMLNIPTPYQTSILGVFEDMVLVDTHALMDHYDEIMDAVQEAMGWPDIGSLSPTLIAGIRVARLVRVD
jgi:hypothetical protein